LSHVQGTQKLLAVDFVSKFTYSGTKNLDCAVVSSLIIGQPENSCTEVLHKSDLNSRFSCINYLPLLSNFLLLRSGLLLISWVTSSSTIAEFQTSDVFF